MKIKTISYGMTINLGNYESVRVDFAAEVDNEESPQEVLNELKKIAKFEEAKIRGSK
jgi:hydrogenase maturation factor